MPDTTLPYFDPRRFDRQVQTVYVIKLALLVGFIISWFGISSAQGAANLWPIACLVGVILGYVVASRISMRTAQQTMQTIQLTAAGATPAELNTALSTLANAFTLNHAVRILIHHQLALLSHRQQNYRQSALIAVTLLNMAPVRRDIELYNKLLILLTDACLQTGDLRGAYGALTDLHRSRLALPQALQLLELQTRYQCICARYDDVLDRLPQKVALAELTPPHVGAQIHALLAFAAGQRHQTHTAKWLADRALLLDPAPQIINVANDMTDPTAVGLASGA